ncbi:MAG: hypothetical protein OYM47_15735 [Gemmatimonadota bacterium]|nr:hypothetical protein [Gemmatimonadota bacterium]
MHEYRHVIVRMRLGQSDLAIAQTGLMGRKRVGQLRCLADCHRFWDLSNPVPDVASTKAAVSLVLTYRKAVTRWWRQGIQGKTINQALVRQNGFSGSYSSLCRFLQGLKQAHPRVTRVIFKSCG